MKEIEALILSAIAAYVTYKAATDPKALEVFLKVFCDAKKKTVKDA